MSEHTKIQWADSTLNFWEGCTKVSDGCKNCYAEARDKRFTGGTLWGKGKARRKSKSAVRDALAYNRKPWVCDACGEAQEIIGSVAGISHCTKCDEPQTFHRRRIFSLSLGDWLDPEVQIEWLAEMLDTIRQCDQVTWILCTKRPERFMERMKMIREEASCASFVGGCGLACDWRNGVAPNNVILLTSVENQQTAEERIPALLKIPAACSGLSLEPLLGEVSLRWLAAFDGMAIKPRSKTKTTSTNEFDGLRKLNWLIIGGESGTNARPCNIEWIRSLVQQGKSAGVATFVKQLGAKPLMNFETAQNVPVGLRDKKGADPAEWPEDLRVQQWPEGF